MTYSKQHYLTVVDPSGTNCLQFLDRELVSGAGDGIVVTNKINDSFVAKIEISVLFTDLFNRSVIDTSVVDAG